MDVGIIIQIYNYQSVIYNIHQEGTANLVSAASTASLLLKSSTHAEEQHLRSNKSKGFKPKRLFKHWAHTPADACTVHYRNIKK